MSTQPALPTQMRLAYEARAEKNRDIVEFFQAHMGEKFSTKEMHVRWQTFRSRKAEINADGRCPIFIEQQGWVSLTEDGPKERSIFWAVPRTQ